jgi:hypothetical protein
MIKPKANVERYSTPLPAPSTITEPEEIKIAAWSADSKAQVPPEQVHLLMSIPGWRRPIGLRFKSPDTLGFIIEELIRYRRLVWPESEKVTGEK